MNSAVFMVGRLQPPTKGHRRLVNRMQEMAVPWNTKPFLFLTKSFDKERNPLSPEMKLDFVQRSFSDVTVVLIQGVFEATRWLAEQGYQQGLLVVGADRAESFAKLPNYGSDVLGLTRLGLHIIPRSSQAIKASEVREAVKKGNFDLFRNLVALTNEFDIERLFRILRDGMGV